MLHDRFLRAYFFIVFGLYTALGFLGAAYCSDPYDEWRLGLMSFVSVPLVSAFLLGFVFDSSYWQKMPKVFWGLVGMIGLCQVWGFVMFLNAVSGTAPTVESRAISSMAMNMAARRGGFGWIYRSRW